MLTVLTSECALNMKRTSNIAETRDASASELVPTPRRINLDSVENVRREMARVYRDMRTGKIPSGEGTRLAFVLAQLGKLLEMSVLEKRIEQLELENLR